MAKHERNFFTQVKELNGELPEVIEEEKPLEKGRRFFAIRKIKRAEDHHPAYQVEVVVVREGKMVEQRLIGKPDTLAMVTGKIQGLVDPINAVESEDETNAILS